MLCHLLLTSAAIARALTLIYTLSLLTLLTRIQLNLLGRRTYLSSVVAMASPAATSYTSHISLENNDDDNYDNVYGNDFETNRKYLTFSWWLLHRGSKEVLQKVSTAVKEVFGPVNLREEMTLERLSQLILAVRKKVEGATEAERRETKWLTHLLPPRDQEDFVLRENNVTDNISSPSTEQPQSSSTSSTANPSLRRLLDETSDLIDSPTFTHVLTLILNATFSHLVDQRIADEAFRARTSTDTPLRLEDITDAKCKFVNMLAVFCRQAHAIAKGSSEPDDLIASTAQNGQAVGGNEYLAKIDAVRDLEGFAAVIYSSNFEFESAEEAAAAGTSASVVNVAEALEEDDREDPVVDIPTPNRIPETEAESKGFEDAWKQALAKEDGKTEP